LKIEAKNAEAVLKSEENKNCKANSQIRTLKNLEQSRKHNLFHTEKKQRVAASTK
jgi:hypothetical protein